MPIEPTVMRIEYKRFSISVFGLAQKEVHENAQEIIRESLKLQGLNPQGQRLQGVMKVENEYLCPPRYARPSKVETIDPSFIVKMPEPKPSTPMHPKFRGKGKKEKKS